MAYQRKKKEGSMIKKILVGVIVILIAAAAGFSFYLGAFSSVTIEKASAGPYRIACLDHIGSYKNTCSKIKSVKKLLDEQGVTVIAPCGVYYDDPKTTPSDKLRSKGGYIIEGNPKLSVAEKLDIPKGEVVTAKTKANPCIAWMKTYPKINRWLSENNYAAAGPSLEIYHDNGITEVQIPITLKEEESEKPPEEIEEETGKS